VSRDSHAQGFQRGYDDGLAGRPSPQPGKDLATADPGYQTYWLALAEGARQGEHERRIRETAAA